MDKLLILIAVSVMGSTLVAADFGVFPKSGCFEQSTVGNDAVLTVRSNSTVTVVGNGEIDLRLVGERGGETSQYLKPVTPGDYDIVVNSGGATAAFGKTALAGAGTEPGSVTITVHQPASDRVVYPDDAGLGGVINRIGGYGVHRFFSDGVFRISDPTYVDLLVVGGGGGGSAAGGGGGGSVLVQTNLYLQAGVYDVYIGAGGAANADGKPSKISRSGKDYQLDFVAAGGSRGVVSERFEGIACDFSGEEIMYGCTSNFDGVVSGNTGNGGVNSKAGDRGMAIIRYRIPENTSVIFFR